MPGGDCCHQQKFSVSREWEAFTPKRVLYVLTSMVTYDVYCSVRKTGFRTMYTVSSHFSENKHLCYFYKSLCLSLEKNVGRQILGFLYTLLQEDGSVKGMGFNEIINYFLYICAVLMIMSTRQLYTVIFN